MNQDAPVIKIDNGWYFGLFIQDDFRFTERFKLQFRAEATNAFNLVNLSNPTTAQNSATFGQIRTARPMR